MILILIENYHPVVMCHHSSSPNLAGQERNNLLWEKLKPMKASDPVTTSALCQPDWACNLPKSRHRKHRPELGLACQSQVKTALQPLEDHRSGGPTHSCQSKNWQIQTQSGFWNFNRPVLQGRLRDSLHLKATETSFSATEDLCMLQRGGASWHVKCQQPCNCGCMCIWR